MRYRGNRDPASRERVKAEYAAVVDRLIKSGTWTEAPSFEDQLPDADMPKAFWDYWFSDEPDRIARDST
jgi:hypothetical protein